MTSHSVWIEVQPGHTIDVRAAIFDFNGTLLLDETIFYEALADVLLPHGIQLDSATYFGALAGFTDRAIFEHLLGEAGVAAGPDTIQRLIDARIALYLERVRDAPPLRVGTIALAKELAARGLPLAIASNAFRDEITEVLSANHLLHLFQGVIGIDDVVKGKPEPEMYLRAFDRLAETVEGLRRREVLVLEDSPAGVKAAEAAGMPCIAVGGTVPLATLAGADMVVPELGPELIYDCDQQPCRDPRLG